MTRKDYVRFAAMLKQQRLNSLRAFYHTSEPSLKSVSNGVLDTLVRVSHATADIFQADNPAFDRARFLKACGVDS